MSYPHKCDRKERLATFIADLLVNRFIDTTTLRAHMKRAEVLKTVRKEFSYYQIWSSFLVVFFLNQEFINICKHQTVMECSLFMGREGPANGETERLELFVAPSMMKDNFFCLPQLEHVNVFDPPPPPPPMMHLLSNHTLILHLALYSPTFCFLH